MNPVREKLLLATLLILMTPVASAEQTSNSMNVIELKNQEISFTAPGSNAVNWEQMAAGAEQAIDEQVARLFIQNRARALWLMQGELGLSVNQEVAKAADASQSATSVKVIESNI